jgi:mono/diheme cytochrome c family protein
VGGGETPLPITLDNLPKIDRLVNPAQRTSESIERGGNLYRIYCQVCHGPEGRGDGPVVPKFIRPPDLTAQQARSYTDGYLYTIIRHGRGIMPAYGDKIRGEDRWHLVNYLRVLQGASR